MIFYLFPGKYSNTPVDVSIIVPLYKSADVVRDQIRRWTFEEGLTSEIIYVDDDCPQKSRTTVYNSWSLRKDRSRFIVRLAVSKRNSGFAAACNFGAHHAHGKYLIFLNADTTPVPNWLLPIKETFESDPQIGIVGNLQLKEGGDLHGSIDSAGSEWHWTGLNFVHQGRHSFQGELIEKPFYPEDCPAEVLAAGEREMVTGCCLAIRKDLFKEIGGFDVRYRIGYWEDTELNLNVREKGYKVVFQPESMVYHKLGHTKSNDHPHHEPNKQRFLNKWVETKRLDKLIKAPRPLQPTHISNILIRRQAAHGDVLVATAVAPALKKKYPGSKVYLSTLCPSVAINNPYLSGILTPAEEAEHTFQYTCDLDLVYERRPQTNILQAYADEAGVERDHCQIGLYCSYVNKPLLHNYVVIHAGQTSWVGRNWFSAGFKEIALRLHDLQKQIVCVGRGDDHFVPCDVDARNVTSINELATIIRDADLFVGIDSLPMHIAQTVNTPGVCFFGSVNPETRIYNPKMTAVRADNLPCLGCHHKKLAPSTVTNRCENGTLNCERLVTVDQMWVQICKMLGIENAN